MSARTTGWVVTSTYPPRPGGRVTIEHDPSQTVLWLTTGDARKMARGLLREAEKLAQGYKVLT